MTVMRNGIEQMRNPIQILDDLAETFNSLSETDPLKSEILTNIGQKYHANELSALLSNWDQYKKMLQDYSEGTGSAAREAEKSANKRENRLTFTIKRFLIFSILFRLAHRLPADFRPFGSGCRL